MDAETPNHTHCSQVDGQMRCNVMQSAHLECRVACGITNILFHLEEPGRAWEDEYIYASHSFAACNGLRAFVPV